MYERPSGSDNAALAARVVELLGGGRAGLITDVDGTLSPIAARPEDAQVLPAARAALAALRGVIDVVAVVSGRRAADARAMVGVDGLVYVGNHGLEVWPPGEQNHDAGPQVVAEARPWVARLARVLEQVEVEIAQPGVLIENKGATASVHYRQAPDPARARRDLLAILARRAVTNGLRVEEGRMVINLLPPLTVTKGSAVTWLAREYHLTRLVYLGDDETDAHAFAALAALRLRGEAETLSIGVVGAETPPRVRALADASVPSVEAVGELLCAAVASLRERARERGGGRPAE